MADIKYEIIKHIGNLSESSRGWTKEDKGTEYHLLEWRGAEA